MSKPLITRKRLLLWLAAPLLSLIFLASIFFYIALGTEYGARRLLDYGLDRVDPGAGLTFSYETLAGNLLGGITFTAVEIGLPQLSANISALEVDIELADLLDNRVTLNRLRLDRPRVRLAGDSESSAVPDIRFSPLPLDISGNDIIISGLQVSNAGTNYVIESLQLSASLSGRDVLVTGLQLQMDGIDLSGEASATLLDALPLTATLDYEWRRALPLKFERAAGTLRLAGDLAVLEVNNELEIPYSVSSAGTIEQVLNQDIMVFDFLHRAARLQLPLEAIAQLSASDLVVETTNRSGDLSLSVDGDINGELVPGIDQLTISADATMRGETLEVSRLNLSHGTGTANGSGRVDWSNAVEVFANYELEEANPQVVLPDDFPTSISALVSSGTVQWMQNGAGGEPELTLDVNRLQARLGEYEMNAGGRVFQRAGLWGVSNMDIATADNRIELDGLIGDSLSLDWQLDVPRLDQFLTEFSGSIQGSGTATGSIDRPLLNGGLQARELSGRGITLDSALLSFDGAGEGYSGSLVADEVSLPTGEDGLFISSLNMNWRGDRNNHEAELEIESNRGRLQSRFRGGFTGTGFVAWEGELDATRLDTELGNWALAEPVAISVSEDRSVLGNGCWLQQQVRLCFDGNRDGDGVVMLNASLTGFPLGEFNRGEQARFIELAAFPRLPQGVTAEGNASLDLSGVINPRGEPDFEFSASAAGARLTVLPLLDSPTGILAEELNEASRSNYYWPLLDFRGSWQDGAWKIVGEAELAGEQAVIGDPAVNGTLRTQLEISALDQLGGNLSANFGDLGWIQALVPQLSRVGGSMESALSFSGTLSAPVLTGEFVLSDVEFFSNRFGVGFSNLNASILADNEGNAGFEGSVNSGQGELSFSGDVTELFSDGREVSGQVQGSDFAFIDLPDLKLELTPRLTVQASAQGIDLSGRVEVPRLHLTLRELPETAVNVSRDVTIVSYPADRPDLARSISASQSQLFDIPVTGEIQLVLGENVEFNGFGLAATFGGELQVQQTANGTNYSYGEVAVQDGVYQLYGQTLQIQQGTLLFLGALENPALDIRAVRVVGDQTVGVLMNGTLRNRHSQLFSSPVLPENDILAVMITGRPYSQLDAAGGAAVIDAIATLGLERGQGITGQIREQLGLDELSFRSTGNLDSTELSLGKYLTPEIFVKYGVGLFDHQTKITVDYWMSDRFKLQGESGEYQSVDLTYTVER